MDWQMVDGGRMCYTMKKGGELSKRGECPGICPGQGSGGGPTTPSFFAEVSNKQRMVNIKCRSISALRRPI